MRAKKVIVGVAISAMLISSSIPVMAFSGSMSRFSTS